MTVARYPIMGEKHRPGGKAVLSSLALNTPLLAVAEPNNAVDPNAIMIFVETRHLTQAAWDNIGKQLPDHHGCRFSEIMDASHWHIGYIAANKAAELQSEGFPQTEVEGKFVLGSNSGPRILLDSSSWRKEVLI